MAAGNLESRTQEIGREIFRRVREERFVVGSPRWWDERMMGLAMRDESVKVQLFRLVDTLPALRNDRQVTRHLREYFDTVKTRLTPGLARVMTWIPEDGLLGGAVTLTARFNAKRLARRF